MSDDEENYKREEQEIPNIRKTYLLTDELTTKLPDDFVFSMNKRYIEIQNCKLYDFTNKEYPDDISMNTNRRPTWIMISNIVLSKDLFNIKPAAMT